MQEALDGYQAALSLRPNADEARAAHYNSACCYARLERWEEAADAVITAVNDFDLKFMVALKDDDLARLRERKEFEKVINEVAGRGGIDEGQYIKMRQEAKSPFMFARTVIFGGLTAGAGLGLLVITGRLVAALKGVPDAPDLSETVQNFAVNSGALALLVFLLLRDRQKANRELKVIEREEMLAKLEVQVNGSRTVTVQTLRGIARPIVIAGTRGWVQRTLKSAEPYRNAIKDRGIELIPVVVNGGEDPDDKIRALKAEMAAESKAAKGFSKSARKTAPATDDDDAGGNKKYEVTVGKKKIVAVNAQDWEKWLNVITKDAGLDKGAMSNVYVQIQLDGSVRASGVGAPPWDKLMADIPTLDSIRSKLMQ